MRKDFIELLEKLMAVPSPSGFEQPAQRVVREWIAPYADDVQTDLHGNVIAIKNPEGYPRVMLAGHCDQIGLMVQSITAEGFLNFAAIGGIDAAVVPGLKVYVHSSIGKVITGVIGRKAIHLMTAEERSKPQLELRNFWIDIGAKDKKEAEKMVDIGDPVTFELGLEKLSKDLVVAAGFDDKVGSFVVMEALRLLSDKKLNCAVYAVSTVQEEIGLRGARTSAYGVDPQIGIAVDVTHATDYPGADKSRGECDMGKGPVIARGANINPVLGKMLVDVAKAKKIPYQIEPAPGGTGTDANAMQISRAGVATALVSIPNRYMHTPVEVVSLKDLDNAAKLLAETLLGIGPKTDFTPM